MNLNNELKSLKKESKRNQKQRSRAERQLRNLQRALKDVENKQRVTMSVQHSVISLMQYVAHLVISGMLSVVSCLIKSARGIRQKSLATLLVVLFVCGLVDVLDHKSHRDGELWLPFIDLYRITGKLKGHECYF